MISRRGEKWLVHVKSRPITATTNFVQVDAARMMER